MMKRRVIGTSVAYGFLLLILIAVMIKSEWVSLFGLILALILLPVAMLLWNLFVRKRTEITMNFPQVVTEKTGLNGELILDTGRLIPAGRITCQFIVKNNLTGEIDKTDMQLNPGVNHFTLSSGHCGEIEVNLTDIWLWDVIGMIPIKYGLFITEKSVILPNVFPVEITEFKNSSSEEENELYTDSKKGSDFSEIMGLREYVPGDDIRGIHWKLSSKTDKTIFRIPGQPIYRTMALFWDRSSGTPDERDSLARVVFSVSLALVDTGLPFLLMTQSDGTVEMDSINTIDDLNEKFPLLMKADKTESEPSTDYRGDVFVFTCGKARPEFNSCAYFCCSEGETFGDAVCFTPSDYKERFEKTEFLI